jgi:hypothetical protein
VTEVQGELLGDFLGEALALGLDRALVLNRLEALEDGLPLLEGEAKKRREGEGERVPTPTAPAASTPPDVRDTVAEALGQEVAVWHGVGDALGMAVLEDPPEEVDEEVEDTVRRGVAVGNKRPPGVKVEQGEVE